MLTFNGITVNDSCNFNRVLNFWSKYKRNVKKFHAIMQSSGYMIILRSKNKQNKISVSNTTYTKHFIKAYIYLVSINTIASF